MAMKPPWEEEEEEDSGSAGMFCNGALEGSKVRAKTATWISRFCLLPWLCNCGRQKLKQKKSGEIIFLAVASAFRGGRADRQSEKGTRMMAGAVMAVTEIRGGGGAGGGRYGGGSGSGGGAGGGGKYRVRVRVRVRV